MIKILVNTTHLKCYFDETRNSLVAKNILMTRFETIDSSMNRDPRVKRGLISNKKNFYNHEYQLLPSGFLMPLTQLFDKANLKYEIIDKRKYVGINKPLVQKLIDHKFSVTAKNGKVYTPRDDQIKAIKACIKYKHGIISASTGFGKTFCIYLLTQIYSKSKILLMFSDVGILQQTYDKFVNDYGIDAKDIAMIQGNNTINEDGRIILLSIFSYEKAYHLFNSVNIIICDEVHETGRNNTAEKILYSVQNASLRFGFSATPKHDNNYETMKIMGNIGPVIYTAKLKDQIDIGTLSQTEVHIIKYDAENVPIIGSYSDVYEHMRITSKMTNNDIDKMISEGWVEYQKPDSKSRYLKRFVMYGDEYNHYINNTTRNRILSEIALRYASQGKRVVGLFEKIEHGKKLQELMPNALKIHGKHSAQERKAVEKQLRDTNGIVVLASDIWSTGIDIEEMDVLINFSVGVSSIKVVQKAGRVVRNSSTTEKHMATIVDTDDSALGPMGAKQSKKRFSIYKSLELPIKIITINS